MKKRLLETHIKKISEQGNVRFHMPGHKGKKIFKIENLETLDFTEVPGADNLHHPEQIIKTVSEKLAALYGSEEACILVNGTTVGLESAIMGVCREGDSLLVPLNCHRSVYAGLALGRVHGVYFSPECDAVLGVCKSVTVRQVRRELEAHPDVRGMVLVNPTYYGTTSDVRAIAEVLHAQKKILIVDEAHGAHLKFCKHLPEDAVTAGADVVVQSTHKLLSALTQSSLLHMQGSLVERTRIKRFLSVLQSSSPNYLLMMSVENAVDEAAERGDAHFSAIAQRWDDYKMQEEQGKVLSLYAPEDGTPYDKSKWLFYVKGGFGISVEEKLRTTFNIQCELSAANHVLGMTGMGTTKQDINQFIDAVAQINTATNLSGVEEKRLFKSNFEYKEVLTLWEALYNRDSHFIPLDQAENHVAADFVIPYPPGIPALLPGGLITREMIIFLQRGMTNGEVVMGIDDQKRVLVTQGLKIQDLKAEID